MNFSEEIHTVKGLDPVADALSGTVYSDVVKMTGADHLTAIIHKGVGAVGTATITVEACDDATGANPVAIPFRYRAITDGDTPGALTRVEATGFTTTAGSSQVYIIEVDSEYLGAIDKAWARIKSVEVVNDPVVAGILLFLCDLRFGPEFQTAIA